MFYYYNALQTKSGDILPDYLVRLLDADGNEVDIYADDSETPIITVSGVANAAKADDLGMVRFWVPNGTYDIAIYDTTDTFKGREESVPMFDAGTLTVDLETSAPDKGAALVALPVGGAVSDAIKHVTPEMFGAAGDYDHDTQTGTDDSVAFQAAIDYLESVGGGRLLCSASYLVGGLTIDARDIVVEGTSRCARIAVKNGEMGFTVSKDWVHFRHIAIISQGNKGDGLGTSGILYTKGTGSIGHVFNYDVDFGIVNAADATAKGCFSGVAIEFRNALDVTMISCLIYKAATGLKFDRNGTGGSDFSTTVRLTNFYVIGCTNYGIDATYVYRSSWNVIGEYNGTAIRVNIGDVSLDRCYFENNTTLGADLIDVGGQDVDNNYSNNAVTDAISRTRSVIGNSDWYTAGQFKGDRWTKRLGLQTAWGRDTEYLTGVGTTDNLGLKYGQAIIPFMPGTDLLDQKAWASVTTSEYMGWDIARGVHKVATTLTGVRGMQQSVSLDSTKTYVAYFLNENIAGNAITTFQVDGNAISNGVPFTVGSTGSKVVRCYASQTITSENYVTFHLFEVLEDQTQIVKGASRLQQQPEQRSRPASAAPASGRWAVGEMVPNTAPALGGPYGWVCTTAGTPGTWTPFGLVGLTKVASAYTATNVTTDRTFDADTVAIAELADVVGTLIADLKTAGLLT